MIDSIYIKACVSGFDNGAYDRLLFLRAVSHAVGACMISFVYHIFNKYNSKYGIICL